MTPPPNSSASSAFRHPVAEIMTRLPEPCLQPVPPPLSQPFVVMRCEAAFEVNQPRVAVSGSKFPLLLVAQIPPTPAEQKFISQSFKCNPGAVG